MMPDAPTGKISNRIDKNQQRIAKQTMPEDVFVENHS